MSKSLEEAKSLRQANEVLKVRMEEGREERRREIEIIKGNMREAWREELEIIRREMGGGEEE